MTAGGATGASGGFAGTGGTGVATGEAFLDLEGGRCVLTRRTVVYTGILT